MSTTTSVVSQLSDLPAIGSGTTSASTSTASNELGEDAFLRLLTTQMQNQDPLNPVDNSQMLAQLAQFSQLSEIQKLSGKIDSMVTATAAASSLSATQLVGKQVSFEATRLGLTSGSTSTFDVVLPRATSDTTAVISDANGKVVRTLHLGAEAAGTSSATWDGLDDTGSPAATGQYYLSVSGKAADGSTVSGAASIRATVTGVTYADGTPKLIVAGQQITLSQVTAVYDASSSS